MHSSRHSFRTFSALTIGAWIVISSLSPAAVELVADLNQTPTGMGSGPIGFARLGEVVLFAATVPSVGRELWKSDGTPEGTVLVKDIRPGDRSGDPRDFVVAGDRVFFEANDGSTGVELWVSDGTAAGTYLVKDFRPGGSSGVRDVLFEIDGALYVSAGSTGTAEGEGLWRVDLSSEETLFLGAGGEPVARLGPTILFRGTAPDSGAELWASDGTPEGTGPLKDIAPGTGSSFPSAFAVSGDQAFFTARTPETGDELWVTDGTAEGTTLVQDIIPGSVSSNPGVFMPFAGRLYFRATDESGTTALWVSDGTEGNTLQLSEALPISGARSFAVFDGKLYFQGNERLTRTELWRTDGTEAGTRLVKDLNPNGSGGATNLTVLGDQLIFTANPGPGTVLWTSDGTEAGTRLVDPLNSLNLSAISNFTLLDDRVLFRADDSERGVELWTSDGTAAGTGIVRDIAVANESSVVRSLTAVGGEVYFYARNEEGAGIWKSDGTASGTVQLTPIASDTQYIVPVGDTVFFVGNDGTHGQELWKSDGTAPGTMMVKDIALGFEHGNVRDPVAWRGMLLFSGAVPLADNPFPFPIYLGSSLWVSDGTDEGTRILFGDDYSELPFTHFTQLTVFNDAIYFVAHDGTHGEEPWRSDGTFEGTAILKDLNPTPNNSGSSNPAEFIGVGDTLYLRANGPELWKSDGTEAGTVLVREIHPSSGLDTPFTPVAAGSRLFFVADDGVSGRELWTSDGTFAGTRLVRDIASGPADSRPANLVAVGDTVYFSATEEATSNELWKSDGTLAGTTLVRDFAPGPDGHGAPRHLVRVGDLIYLQARDSVHGAELWEHDTRTGGTRLVADIIPGSGSSEPENLVVAGDQLFFTAESDEAGRELHVYQLPPNQPPVFAGYAVASAPGRAITISLAKMLAGGGDPDGDRFTIEVVGGAAEGASVTLGEDAITYVPPAGFTGMDSFVIMLTDSRGATATGTVTVMVDFPDSGPGAANALRLSPLPNGHLLIQFQGIPGRAYRLERYDVALMTWQNVVTLVAGPLGEITHVDSDPAPGVGFYRFVEP